MTTAVDTQAILDRFQGVRKNGPDWMALCPAHADKNPSLAIKFSNGQALLKCHAGCETKAVLAAAGMTFTDLGPAPTQRKIIAEYPYRDENDELLYQVVRFEPKDFRQRKPDGKDGWVYSLNGTRRVIYNLSKIIAADEVVICEGEKDAESAGAIGLVATSNVGGAGKWLDEYSDFFVGKKVTIIADADTPGRKHAREVANSLHLKASSVKIIEMPRGKKDLSEFVQSMSGACTTETLKSLVVTLAEDAPEWDPDAPAPEVDWRSEFHSFVDFENAAQLTFSIAGFLQNNAATIIGGLSGHSKTMLMLSMVKALLAGEGELLWGHFRVMETATRVLYLIPESTIEPFKHRLQLFKLYDYLRPESDRLLVRTLSKGPTPCLSDAPMLAAAKGAHVFLDTAVRFSAEGDENSASDNQRGLATDIFALLGAGARTVVGAHHSPKSFARENVMGLENVLRGSGDVGAMVATAWGVKQLDAVQNIIQIENIKPRDFQPPEPFQLIGRPHIDQAGDFEMYKKPGECGFLMDEQQSERNKGGAPESRERQDRIGITREWIAEDPNLTVADLVQKFRDSGVAISERTARRYKNLAERTAS
jgi:5S rRNA maturation endonuclease (ribonuclease M5)